MLSLVLRVNLDFLLVFAFLIGRLQPRPRALASHGPKVLGASYYSRGWPFLFKGGVGSGVSIEQLVGFFFEGGVVLGFVGLPAPEALVEVFHGQVASLVGVLILEDEEDFVFGDGEVDSVEELLQLLHGDVDVDGPAEVVSFQVGSQDVVGETAVD